MSFCEYDDELSGSAEGGGFLNQLTNYDFLGKSVHREVCYIAKFDRSENWQIESYLRKGSSQHNRAPGARFEPRVSWIRSKSAKYVSATFSTIDKEKGRVAHCN